MHCSPPSYFQWQSTQQQLHVQVKSHFSFFFLYNFNVSKSTLSEQCAFPAAKRRGKQLFLPDAACWMECKYVNHPEFITFECSSNATADTSLIYDIPLIMRAVEIISQAASSFQAATISVPSVHSTRTDAHTQTDSVNHCAHPHRNINIHTHTLAHKESLQSSWLWAQLTQQRRSMKDSQKCFFFIPLCFIKAKFRFVIIFSLLLIWQSSTQTSAMPCYAVKQKWDPMQATHSLSPIHTQTHTHGYSHKPQGQVI